MKPKTETMTKPMIKSMTKQSKQNPMVLVANRLTDGTTVFLGKQGLWRTQINGACLAYEQARLDELEETGRQSVANNQVVDPQLVEVEISANSILPILRREKMRVFGPSVQFLPQSRKKDKHHVSL